MSSGYLRMLKYGEGAVEAYFINKDAVVSENISTPPQRSRQENKHHIWNSSKSRIYHMPCPTRSARLWLIRYCGWLPCARGLACRCPSSGKVICEVIQLVVHRDHRERVLAVSLLRKLKRDDHNVYGIASSHPATCLVPARAFMKLSGPTV